MAEPLPLPPLPRPRVWQQHETKYGFETIRDAFTANQMRAYALAARAEGYAAGLAAAEKAAKDLPRLATDDYTEGYAEGCDQCAAAIRALPRQAGE